MRDEQETVSKVATEVLRKAAYPKAADVVPAAQRALQDVGLNDLRSRIAARKMRLDVSALPFFSWTSDECLPVLQITSAINKARTAERRKVRKLALQRLGVRNKDDVLSVRAHEDRVRSLLRRDAEVKELAQQLITDGVSRATHTLTHTKKKKSSDTHLIVRVLAGRIDRRRRRCPQGEGGARQGHAH